MVVGACVVGVVVLVVGIGVVVIVVVAVVVVVDAAVDVVSVVIVVAPVDDIVCGTAVVVDVVDLTRSAGDCREVLFGVFRNVERFDLCPLESIKGVLFDPSEVGIDTSGLG